MLWARHSWSSYTGEAESQSAKILRLKTTSQAMKFMRTNPALFIVAIGLFCSALKTQAQSPNNGSAPYSQPLSYENQLAQAREYIRVGQSLPAVTASRQAISLDARRWEAYVLAAAGYSVGGLTAEAVQMLKEALSRAPREYTELIREALANAGTAGNQLASEARFNVATAWLQRTASLDLVSSDGRSRFAQSIALDRCALTISQWQRSGTSAEIARLEKGSETQSSPIQEYGYRLLLGQITSLKGNVQTALGISTVKLVVTTVADDVSTSSRFAADSKTFSVSFGKAGEAVLHLSEDSMKDAAGAEQNLRTLATHCHDKQ